MKKSNLFRNVIAISVSFGAMVLLGTNSSKAVLQSNGNDAATYSRSDWMMNVRKMEELGGAMGLSETVDSNLTSSSDSNNIDVHMEKNTEYGALAILSASSYGNPNKINDGETTTGNATGVVMKLNMEWVAAGTESSPSTNFKNAVSRYKNVYEWGTHTKYGDSYAKYTKKSGDAIEETKNWHGSGASQWLSYYGYEYVAFNWVELALLRSYSGSIFSYYGYSAHFYNDGNISTIGNAFYTNLHTTRSVIVQGDGI